MSLKSRPAHFLLVEDEQSHADLMRMSFDEYNVSNTIDHVVDGKQAMDYLRREGDYAQAARPDIILLDLKLPRLDGHEVLRAIKSDPELRTIPVVVLTTSSNETDRDRAYRGHANSFLTKPVDFASFMEMARDLRLYWTVWNVPPHGVINERQAG